MVDPGIAAEDEPAHRNDGVALLLQVFQNRGQGLRRVEPGVVEQHDAAGPGFCRDPSGDLRRAELLPVQRVSI